MVPAKAGTTNVADALNHAFLNTLLPPTVAPERLFLESQCGSRLARCEGKVLEPECTTGSHSVSGEAQRLFSGLNGNLELRYARVSGDWRALRNPGQEKERDRHCSSDLSAGISARYGFPAAHDCREARQCFTVLFWEGASRQGPLAAAGSKRQSDVSSTPARRRLRFGSGNSSSVLRGSSS